MWLSRYVCLCIQKKAIGGPLKIFCSLSLSLSSWLVERCPAREDQSSHAAILNRFCIWISATIYQLEQQSCPWPKSMSLFTALTNDPVEAWSRRRGKMPEKMTSRPGETRWSLSWPFEPGLLWSGGEMYIRVHTTASWHSGVVRLPRYRTQTQTHQICRFVCLFDWGIMTIT